MSEVKKHKKAFELFSQHGMSKRQIAQELGVAVGTITYWSSPNCRCECGYHNWSEAKELMSIDQDQDETTACEVLDPEQSAVVVAETQKLRGLILKIISVIEAKIDDGSVAPKTWGQVLETFEMLREFRDFLSPSEGASVQYTEKKKLKFSSADIDRFADLFLKKHVVEGEGVLESEPSLIDIENISVTEQIEKMIEGEDED